MKAIVICPAERPAVVELAARSPLATAPLLGRSVLEYWIEALAGRGVTDVLVLASDRPNRVREHVGDGRRWGVRVEVQPTAHEPTPEEARRRYRRDDAGPWLPGDEVIVADRLPGRPDLPLFESYAGWFAAQRAFMPAAAASARVGTREIAPGVWVGLRAEIHRSARLVAPCWIGDYVRVESGAVVGPGATIEDRSLVDRHSRVVESTVFPDTYVGRHVSVERSIALGSTLVHQGMNSVVQVPDPFLVGDLRTRGRRSHRTTAIGRAAALVMLLAGTPFALGVVGLSVLRGETPWHLRLGLRSQEAGRPHAQDTFAYYELGGAQNWLRRWPQFWSVFRGDMAWFGNRPLRPTQALTLANDFERLWLAAPVGVISLADAHGCPDGIGDEAIAHASYYAVHASRRLDAFILGRTLQRAALVWPIRAYRRRKDAAVPLQDLMPRQEL